MAPASTGNPGILQYALIMRISQDVRSFVRVFDRIPRQTSLVSTLPPTRIAALFVADDAGTYEPWVRPLLLSVSGRVREAQLAQDRFPNPPKELFLEVSWSLIALAAIATKQTEGTSRALGLSRPPKQSLQAEAAPWISAQLPQRSDNYTFSSRTAIRVPPEKSC